MTKNGLSHAEVWDDSALVTSWNEALEEYKKYHSLAAKGEKVQMVLDQAENGVLDNDHDMAATNEPPQADVKPLEAHATEEGKKPGVDVPKATSAETSKAPATNVPTAASTAAIPQALLSSVQDENLKNIMMSWYYAGYYTGLYEGQQKASAALQPDG